MHRLLPLASVLVLAVVCALSQSALAGVPPIVTQQGRLLDSGGDPLTGSFSITYSIFEIPTGGAPLWTETHPAVAVEDGLFAVQLGSITPLDANLLTSGGGGGGAIERYLEISVGGSVITPRTRLVSSPYSVASSRVSGDIQTGPSRIVVGDLNGDGHADLIANPDSVVNDYVQDNSPNNENRVKIRVTPIDAEVSMGRGGSTTATIRTGATGGHIGLGGMSGSTTGTIRMMATPDSTVDYRDVDSDDDGIPESSDRRTVSANDIHHNVISRSGSTTGTIRMMATPDSTVDYRDVDSDDDGIPESSDRRTVSANDIHHNVMSRGGSTTGTIRMAASPDSASSSLDWDSDNDGIPEASLKTKGSSSGASSILGGMSGSTTGTIRMAASGGGGPILPSSSVVLEADLDGDGVVDNSCTSSSDGSGSSIAQSSRFGSGPRQTTSMDCTPSSSRIRCASDSDDDGIADHFVSMDGLGYHAQLTLASDSTDDGTVDNSLDAVVTPTKSSLAIKTKGTSAQRQSVSMGTESAGKSTFVCAIDDDADGISDRSVGGDCDDTDASFAVRGGGGGGGGAQNSVQFTVDAQGPIVDITKPGDGSMTFTVDATGPTVQIDEPSSANSIKWNVDTQGPVVELTAPGTSSSVTFEVDATGPAIRMTNGGTVTSDIDGSGNAYFSSNVGVGVAVPTHHIDVTGGAYCDGTNWVNASDRNSKENFQNVDGEELLGMIADLEITKWNYKGDESTRHIGPTAQDFKEKFGVGSDGKSISTIDPSGIALAAIKELYKQFSDEMKQKDAQIEQLQKEMKKLREELQKRN